jgi:hypothetical protein
MQIIGKSLRRSADREELPVELQPADPSLIERFSEQAAQVGLTSAELDSVRDHARVAYLTASPAGAQAAALVLGFGAALVRAGGWGVYVPASRKVVPAQTWLQLASHPPRPDVLVPAFVSLANMPDGSGTFTSGMQLFGLQDAQAPADLSPERAVQVLTAFCVERFRSALQVQDGEGRFQPHHETQRYRVRLREGAHFPPGHPQHNPNGFWQLL